MAKETKSCARCGNPVMAPVIELNEYTINFCIAKDGSWDTSLHLCNACIIEALQGQK